MKTTDENFFVKVSTRPNWEGIIFTDLDFNDQRISIFSVEPTPQLKNYIESIWFMRWDLGDTKSLRSILVPNPCAKLVTLQKNNKTFPSIFIGATKEAEFFELEGTGCTVGFDFKPGGYFPIMQMSPQSGKLASEIFQEYTQAPQEHWTEKNLALWINELQNILVNSLKKSKKNNYEQISLITKKSLEGAFTSPEDMANQSGISLRSLQRIFHEEVGVSPRDLLRITRFNEAIRKISDNDFEAFSDIALASGFFDQPHMANEFKKLVDMPPSKFRRYL